MSILVVFLCVLVADVGSTTTTTTTTESMQIDGGYCTVTTTLTYFNHWYYDNVVGYTVPTAIETVCVCSDFVNNPYNPRNPLMMCRTPCSGEMVNTANTEFCVRNGSVVMSNLRPSCPSAVCTCIEPGDDLCYPLSATPSPTSTLSPSLSTTPSPSFGTSRTSSVTPSQYASTSSGEQPKLGLITMIFAVTIFWMVTTCFAP